MEITNSTQFPEKIKTLKLKFKEIPENEKVEVLKNVMLESNSIYCYLDYSRNINELLHFRSILEIEFNKLLGYLKPSSRNTLYLWLMHNFNPFG